MASCKLTVPVLKQELAYCCWHTSAMMIWLYWQNVHHRQGPMFSVAPVYTANRGMQPQQFITLASNVGLTMLGNRNLWTQDDLATILQTRGPVWCAGHWFGPGHIIVLTGADGGHVFFNDPGDALRKTARIDWFNAKLDGALKGCMMVKNPAAY